MRAICTQTLGAAIARRGTEWVTSAGRDTALLLAMRLRSPIDYRITIARENGRWRVMFFLAGD